MFAKSTEAGATETGIKKEKAAVRLGEIVQMKAGAMLVDGREEEGGDYVGRG